MNVVLISLQFLLYYDCKRCTLYTAFHVVMNDNKDYFTLTHKLMTTAIMSEFLERILI